MISNSSSTNHKFIKLKNVNFYITRIEIDVYLTRRYYIQFLNFMSFIQYILAYFNTNLLSFEM